MSPIGTFTICGLIIIGVFTSTLTVFLQESFGAFKKPNFTDTELGKKCSGLWDVIQQIKRELSHKLTGKEKLETEILTEVANYNSDCQPTYGGTPRLGSDYPPGSASNLTAGDEFLTFSELFNLTSNITVTK